MRYSATLDYALALILKGDNRGAVKVIEDFLRQMRSPNRVTEENRDCYRVLALAHMRMAEAENCISHHHSQACLIPLRGDGVHHEQAPARQSLGYLNQLL